ncbi:MAG: transketolase [Candidatus Doudnabacteria bacterium RIFCSPHIGHO2_01_FULL_46_14]|uniref:Transketolase n=1 Tax=Candidatus Doudnabacteria bacterium RIFCSPHIGHO2_01_FULL_46_14 TaxID=1817824 RepID=A0A1F5NNX5_9BACT|nr:MAG: transketolase [Candidatus Doudnabacteria bacterium RIFCSPHIGHO2_01_FULL_46_14]
MRDLEKLAKLVRYFSLTMSSKAGSGHPTSSLSATDLMVSLMFGGHFKFDLKNPGYHNNDRLIFSKGHASPLFFALWAAAGVIEEKELDTYRTFNSRLEGHPTLAFPYTEVPTGSLGQGLSVGAGMAMNAELDNLNYRTFVLLGDSEMAEGSVWEAMAWSAHNKLDNLVAILDVNRLGQRGETMYGHHTEIYEKKAGAFGWETIVIDGHDFKEIDSAYERAFKAKGKPVMIIAKTLKGKGISFIEDKDGKHGVALKQDELEKALGELGEVDLQIRGGIVLPENVEYGISNIEQKPTTYQLQPTSYPFDKPVATRKAYGNALNRIYPKHPNMIVLDAEVSNSTFAEIFGKAHPERFLEMFIAEQNMVGVALGLARRGKLPFVSTFAAFFSRAFDQIRMSGYASANIKFCGSHAGVSIGEDGASQMGLEDIAMFRTIQNSVVLYPSDAVSAEKLVEAAAEHEGLVYIRTTRKDTPIIYSPLPNPPPQGEGNTKDSSSPLPGSPKNVLGFGVGLRGEDEVGVRHEFRIGGSCTLKSSDKDVATVIGVGVTLHEALKAYEELKKEGIMIRVIDLYSVKPLDIETLKKAVAETKAIITVEDHYPEGGIGEAVASALTSFPPLEGEGKGGVRFVSLAVCKLPRSGKPDELLNYEEINSSAIVKKVREMADNG